MASYVIASLYFDLYGSGCFWEIKENISQKKAWSGVQSAVQIALARKLLKFFFYKLGTSC